MSEKKERIAKLMARSGLCSRREAENWINAGRVKVNGEIIYSPALNVSAADKILVDEKPLPEQEPPRLWLFHKPDNAITSNKDPGKRKTVFEFLPKSMPRVISVGRLDLNSEGLLLLTNDGELARFLEHPSKGWERSYRVRVFGRLDKKRLDDLKNGISIKDEKSGSIINYGAVKVTIEKQGKNNSWLLFLLKEGKNREIRRICEHLGLQVNRLIRISFGPFNLGKIPVEGLSELPYKVIRENLPGFFE